MARFDAFEAFSKDDFDHPFLNSSPDFTPRHSLLRTSRPIGDMTTNMSFRDRSKRLLDIENEKNQLVEVNSPSVLAQDKKTDFQTGPALSP
jgi:hypothetical protein